MYKPFHLIGLELSISVLNAALRGEATGTTREWRGDVAATTKRSLKAGDMLDGEGGFTVYGKLCRASDARAAGTLPIGLAHGVRLIRDVSAGSAVTYADVAVDETMPIMKLRRELESGSFG
jgi:predicted homoserine dehydrogenase-like protein